MHCWHVQNRPPEPGQGRVDHRMHSAFATTTASFEHGVGTNPVSCLKLSELCRTGNDGSKVLTTTVASDGNMIWFCGASWCSCCSTVGCSPQSRMPMRYRLRPTMLGN